MSRSASVEAAARAIWSHLGVTSWENETKERKARIYAAAEEACEATHYICMQMIAERDHVRRDHDGRVQRLGQLVEQVDAAREERDEVRALAKAAGVDLTPRAKHEGEATS